MRRFIAALGLLAAACTKQKATAPIETALTALVASDTTTLAGARLDELRKTALYQRYAASQNLPQLDQFIAEAGFDPRADLSEVLIAHNGKEAVVLVRGRFKVPEIESKLISAGGKKSDHNGRALISHERNAVAFLDATTAAGGPEPLVRATLDRVKRRETLPAPLETLLKNIPNHAHGWVVNTGGLELNLPPGGNLANLNKVAGLVASFYAWTNLSQGVRMNAAAYAPDEANAKKLHTTVRGLIGLARLSTPDDRPELLRVFDSLEVRQDRQSVLFNADMPLALVDKLLEAAGLVWGGRPHDTLKKIPELVKGKRS